MQGFSGSWVCDRRAGGGYRTAWRVDCLKRTLREPDIARVLSRETGFEVRGVDALRDEPDALVGLFDQ
jgi:hypothetical protein